MTARQKSERLRPLSSIFHLNSSGCWETAPLAFFVSVSSTLSSFTTFVPTLFGSSKIHEANRAGGAVALQSHKRILTLFPVIFPAVSRAQIAVCLPLRARFAVSLLSQEEEPAFRLLRFWWRRRVGVGEGRFWDRGRFLVLRGRDVENQRNAVNCSL